MIVDRNGLIDDIMLRVGMQLGALTTKYFNTAIGRSGRPCFTPLYDVRQDVLAELREG